MYTFCVITYNEEKYILQALESIRYQVKTYGGEKTYQIIIADDCSVDSTTKYVDYWLSQYGYLFKEITLLYQQQNKGTVQNVIDAFCAIHGEKFYCIAGDDILPQTDLFSVLEKNADVDVLASASLILQGDKIITNRRNYMDILAQSLYTTKYIEWSIGMGCPIQAGVAWSKRLHTKQVFDFMQNFRLLDDRPKFYAAWLFFDSISYKYINVPLYIYRKNISSVSNFKGSHRSTLNDDLKKYYYISKKNGKNLFYKFCVDMQMRLSSLRGRGIFSYIRYIAPYYLVEEAKRLFHLKKIKLNYQELMKDYLEANQEHVNNIMKMADQIRKSYELSGVN